MSDTSLLRGAIAAPFAAPVAALLLAPLFERPLVAMAPLLALVILAVAFAGTVVIGLPLLFLLRALGWLFTVIVVPVSFAFGWMVGHTLPSNFVAWGGDAKASLFSALVCTAMAIAMCIASSIPFKRR